MSSERALSARPTAIAGRLSGWLLVLACLVLWEASARFGAIESTSWPPFTSVVSAALAGFASGELPRIVLSTLGRMVAGFAFGSAAGVAVGLLLGTLPVLSRALTPTLEGLRPLPIPAIVPPLILFLGLDDLLKITVVAIAVFFPVMVNTLGGVRNIDPVLLATARTFRLSRAGTLMAVVLPAALPSVMAGLRTALALALVTTIVAETSRRSDAMPSRRRAARSTSSRAMTTRPGSEPASRPSRIGKRRSVAPASTATS